MDAFSTGDMIFIACILALIHGIMLCLGFVRRRKARRSPGTAE